MAIWDRLFKSPRLRGMVRALPWAEAPNRGLSDYLHAYGRIYSLFGICLRRATAVSEVKWRLFKVDSSGKRTAIHDHPILKLLDFANEFQTGQEIIELHQLHSDLAGRAFWYLPQNGFGIPGEIWLLPPDKVSIVPSRTDFIKGYVLNLGTEKIPFTKDEIIWFPMPDPVNQYGGVGYAQAASIELDSEDYSGRWNRNFFYNSARADAVLEYEDELTDEEFDRVAKLWQERHEGLSKAHKIAILDGGAKYKQIQTSQKDMDFSMLRKQTRENLLFTFGMPLSVMGITENVNRANAEAGDYLFARWIVKPALTRIRNKLNEQLVPMYKAGSKIEIDFDEVVPETVDQRRANAESGVKTGYLTVNEARQQTGFDPIPNGDQLLLPMNLFPTPIDSLNLPPEEPKSKGLSEEQKDSTWWAYTRLVERLEHQFIKVLSKLWEKQKREVISNLQRLRTVEGSLFSADKEGENFASSLEPLIEEAYEQGIEGRAVERQVDEIARAWLADRSLEMAKGINETTLKALRSTLLEGFDEGESIPRLARRVRSVYSDAERHRAFTIARTEIVTASNKGAEQRYRQEGVERVEWYTALDERTCPECFPLHGKTYAINDGPRPALHPNCRCVITAVV